MFKSMRVQIDGGLGMGKLLYEDKKKTVMKTWEKKRERDLGFAN